jgi:hypothetical protein
MKKPNRLFLFSMFIFLIAIQGYSQKEIRRYINVGYVTNLKACEECVKADAGFSVRIGRISEKRLGYYAGFIYFKEFHPDWEV